MLEGPKVWNVKNAIETNPPEKEWKVEVLADFDPIQFLKDEEQKGEHQRVFLSGMTISEFEQILTNAGATKAAYAEHASLRETDLNKLTEEKEVHNALGEHNFSSLHSFLYLISEYVRGIGGKGAPLVFDGSQNLTFTIPNRADYGGITMRVEKEKGDEGDTAVERIIISPWKDREHHGPNAYPKGTHVIFNA